jgi:hypothetical protein
MDHVHCRPKRDGKSQRMIVPMSDRGHLAESLRIVLESRPLASVVSHFWGTR